VHSLEDALRDLLWIPEDEARRLADDVAADWPEAQAGGGFLNVATPWATVLAWAAVGALLALIAVWLVNRVV
jgi:hypothetical protein